MVASDTICLAFAPCTKSKYSNKLVFPDGVEKKFESNKYDHILFINDSRHRINKVDPPRCFAGWSNVQPNERERNKLVGTYDIATIVKYINKEAKDKDGKKVHICDEVESVFDINEALKLLRFLANFDDKVSIYKVVSAYYTGGQITLSTKTAQGLIMPYAKGY